MNIFEKYGLKVSENVALAPYTTYKIGGPARYFKIVKDEGDLKKLVNATLIENIPIYIIGMGSNILVNDLGFNGLVIKIMLDDVKVHGNFVICGAGAHIGKVLKKMSVNKLVGLEYMTGIPTTVGGAVFGNAGAFGHDIGEAVESVKIFKFEKQGISEEIFTKKDCCFSYRQSVFKNTKSKNFIIVESVLSARKGDVRQSEKEIEEILKKREKTYPKYPSTGCIFKNIPYKKEYLHLSNFVIDKKISAGKLIDEAGLKGFKHNDAEISSSHANFIVNLGKAKASDIKYVITHVKEVIKEKYKVQLKEEIEYVGF